MILIDLSGVVIGAVIKTVTANPKELSLELVRNVAINRVLQFKNKFKKYGDVVICADSQNYWRKDVFPEYKQNRKKARKKSKVDWQKLSSYLNTVQAEMKEYLPYIYLEIDKCEADDIIAVICKYYHSKKPDAKGEDIIMIVSSDKDMLQLQKFKHIDQFSTAAKAIISNDVSDYHLTEHVIRGDSSDGVPNILSDDDVFLVEGKRQKAISATFIKDSLKMSAPQYICPTKESFKKYERNKVLIDLECIPENYVADIRTAFDEALENTSALKMKKSRLFTYLVKNRMRILMDKLSEF